MRRNGVQPGGPDVRLGRADLNSVKRIRGDGNCLFRSLSYVITGAESQHHAIRSIIVMHMYSIGNNLMCNYINSQIYPSLGHYIESNKMYENGIWGTDVEMVTLAHLLNTSIYVYSPNFGDDGVDRNGRWIRHSPHSVDTTLPDVPSQMAMYLLAILKFYLIFLQMNIVMYIDS